MKDWPETSESLILRVKDPADAAAWYAFLEIYRPVLYRLARSRGLQDADAEDLAQAAIGSSTVQNMLHNVPEEEAEASAQLLHESRMQAFRWASEQVRHEFTPTTWNMFWQSTVEERSIDEVAKNHDRSKGAAYLARYRVMKRLKEKLDEVSDIWGEYSWPVEVSKPAIDLEINGQSVSKITYQGSSPEKSLEQLFEQTGPKSWMSGEAVYNEVKRNEWHVHLQRAAEFDERVQIDLSQMAIHFRGQGPKEALPILSASKPLSAAAEAAIEQARLSSAESSSDQADHGMTNSIGMKLMPIAKGKLQMGSLFREEGYRLAEPRHEVTLTRNYYLGAFEVTQAQYSKLMGDNPSKFQGYMIDNADTSNQPVDRVSWEDAVEFCKRLSELPEEKTAGRVYRLPTEAEWEYACRAGSNAPFGFGGLELADDYGWFSSNCKGKSQPVGKKDPNAWGLYDMHGNVMEWCSDWAGDYPEGAVSDPTGPKDGGSRMIRGGAWLRPAMLGRSGDRAFHFPPDTRSDYVGFRVALSSPEVSN